MWQTNESLVLAFVLIWLILSGLLILFVLENHQSPLSVMPLAMRPSLIFSWSSYYCVWLGSYLLSGRRGQITGFFQEFASFPPGSHSTEQATVLAVSTFSKIIIFNLGEAGFYSLGYTLRSFSVESWQVSKLNKKKTRFPLVCHKMQFSFEEWVWPKGASGAEEKEGGEGKLF